jgi:hypothetical protein
MRATLYIVRHISEAALIIIGISALEALMTWLWHPAKPLLFDIFPLKYIFHAMDVGVLLVFGYHAISGLWRVLGERDQD